MRPTIATGLLVAGAISIAAQDGQQVFRSGVQGVFVDVSVLKNGVPLSDLRTADFHLTDNDVPQPLELATGAVIPLDVTLVLNSTHVAEYYGMGGKTPASAGEAQRDVRAIAASLRSGDRLEVLTFASKVVETRSMTAVGPNPAQIAVSNPMTDVLDMRYRITESLLAALTSPVPPDRRHLVVVFALGDGTPAVSPLEHLLPVARRADALLYAVLSPEHHEIRTNRPFAFYPSEDVLRSAVTQAAEITGGKAYLTGDIVGAFGRILKEFRSSYVLRYTVQGVPTAGWHDIVVTVPSCPDCTIRARRGYMGQ